MGGWGVALGAFARYGVCGEDGSLYAETRIQAPFPRKNDTHRKTDTGPHRRPKSGSEETASLAIGGPVF